MLGNNSLWVYQIPLSLADHRISKLCSQEKNDKLAAYTIATRNSIAHHLFPSGMPAGSEGETEIAAGTITILLPFASLCAKSSFSSEDIIKRREKLYAHQAPNDKKRKRMG